jgi:hypothetical protein
LPYQQQPYYHPGYAVQSGYRPQPAPPTAYRAPYSNQYYQESYYQYPTSKAPNAPPPTSNVADSTADYSKKQSDNAGSVVSDASSSKLPDQEIRVNQASSNYGQYAYSNQQVDYGYGYSNYYGYGYQQSSQANYSVNQYGYQATNMQTYGRPPPQLQRPYIPPATSAPPKDNDSVSIRSSTTTASISIPHENLEAYRQEVKKSKDPIQQFEFAKQLILVAEGIHVKLM